jgi:hypothetical protein
MTIWGPLQHLVFSHFAGCGDARDQVESGAKCNFGSQREGRIASSGSAVRRRQATNDFKSLTSFLACHLRATIHSGLTGPPGYFAPRLPGASWAAGNVAAHVRMLASWAKDASIMYYYCPSGELGWPGVMHTVHKSQNKRSVFFFMRTFSCLGPDLSSFS